MHFYLVGEMMRRQGYKVSYDVTWFDTWGWDINCKFRRNLHLSNMFPYLQWTPRRKGLVNLIYSQLHEHHNDYFKDEPTAWLGLKPPVYMTGYYQHPDEMFTKIFDEVFHLDYGVLDEKNQQALQEIRSKGQNAVAIHVRRGDLSTYLESYGEPVSVRYFADAIKLIQSKIAYPAFFVFSDEPDWCRENILPLIPDAKIMDINSSDTGYLDLALIANCPNVITSKGSFGKYEAMLRPKDLRDGIVVLCEDMDIAEWGTRFSNTYSFPL